jgi:hypothetical protein
MSTVKISGYTQLVTQTCCDCGVMFAMPEALRERALQHRGPAGHQFYCPNGHAQHYLGKTDLEKANVQLQWERERAARLSAELEQTTASLRAQRGVTTKLKKRIAGGVCPCCKRSFKDLYRHMAGRHPDFVQEPAA